MYFYTNAFLQKDKIYTRGFANGKRFQDEIDYQPYLFVETSKSSEFQNLNGHPVEKKKFHSASDAKRFAETSIVFGNLDFLYQFINDEFPGSIEFDIDRISKITIDIEVIAKEGFPNTKDAAWPISAITITHRDKIYVFGMKEYKTSNKNVKYFLCFDEKNLLNQFINVWKELDPDVVTGWNIEKFDIPYLVNRIARLLGSNPVKDLSPFGIVWEQEVETNKDTYYQYHIKGITVLDYLPLYKKFKLGNEESYSLNHIAQVEIGESKIDYSEHGTLNELYDANFALYIDYNIYDCVLVDKIDKKCNYIAQCITMAYNAKVTYTDVLGTVKPWDVMITNYLFDKKIVVPQPTKNEPSRRIMGGHVKEPQIGLHQWVVTIDLVSMYPHIIMGCNISPEKVRKYIKTEVSDALSNMIMIGTPTPKKTEDIFTPTVWYSNDTQGFFPALMERLFNQRAEAKVKLKEAKKNKDERMIAHYDNFQNAQKILLNGGYGAMANEYFRFYDEDMAESVTATGQLLIQFIERKVNDWLNNTLKTKDIDYVVAIDTDSIHLTLDALVHKVGMDGKERQDVARFLDKVFKEKVLPLTEQWCLEFSTAINAMGQKFKFNREVIADKAIWRAAKMYIMNVIDDEGLYQDPPKIKMKGIEAVRSSTPFKVRGKIKDCLFLIMNKDEETVQKYCLEFKEWFMSQPFEEIATPSSVKGLTKYADSDRIYKLSTPMHVKGSLIYNYLIKRAELTDKYPLINEGDKVRFAYLKTPNYIRQTCIAAPDKLPHELNLDEIIDKERQFERVFQKPIESLLEPIKWTFYDKSTESVMALFA